MEESLTICRCQVDKLDRPAIGNIDHVGENVVLSWQKIIRRNGQPTEVDTDMNHNQHKSNPSGYLHSSTGILEPMIDKIKISEKQLTKTEYSHLGKNRQAIMLYNII